MAEKIRIMIAEDFDLLREDLCELINSQSDMEVVGAAATGSQITKLAKENDCDIILMDIEMENIKAGIVAAEDIKEVKPEQKIIFLTAHETENMIFTAMGTGALDYVVKGGSEEELLHHIRRAQEGKPVMEANIQAKIMQEYSRLRQSERSLLFFINNVSQLTRAERELIHFLLQGKKVNEIAQLRCVEPITVKTQVKSLLRKFGCSRTKEIVQMIQKLNLAYLF
ncbi:MAG: response regulator transcription factor [Clostridia bacterium]|jgi:NarL family two-component system response regulator LiaR|nr:response regulator transcription factor [Clostridia bacterium]